MLLVLAGSLVFWGHGAIGSAPALQAGGYGFESRWLHRSRCVGGACSVPPCLLVGFSFLFLAFRNCSEFDET